MLSVCCEVKSSAGEYCYYANVCGVKIPMTQKDVKDSLRTQRVLQTRYTNSIHFEALSNSQKWKKKRNGKLDLGLKNRK